MRSGHGFAIVNSYPPTAAPDDLWQHRLGGSYECVRTHDAAEKLHKPQGDRPRHIVSGDRSGIFLTAVGRAARPRPTPARCCLARGFAEVSFEGDPRPMRSASTTAPGPRTPGPAMGNQVARELTKAEMLPEGTFRPLFKKPHVMVNVKGVGVTADIRSLATGHMGATSNRC